MESNPWYKDKVYPDWGQADKLYFAQNTNMNYTGFAKAWGADVSGKVRIIPIIYSYRKNLNEFGIIMLLKNEYYKKLGLRNWSR